MADEVCTRIASAPEFSNFLAIKEPEPKRYSSDYEDIGDYIEISVQPPQCVVTTSQQRIGVHSYASTGVYQQRSSMNPPAFGNTSDELQMGYCNLRKCPKCVPLIRPKRCAIICDIIKEPLASMCFIVVVLVMLGLLVYCFKKDQ